MVKQQKYKEEVDQYGYTPLMNAILENDRQRVIRQIQRGAKLNRKVSLTGHSPLHVAIEQGSKGLVKILLGAGAPLNSKNNFGDTPLHIAVYENHVGIVKLLLNAGAIIDSRNNFGMTPLHLAVKGNEYKMTKLLLDAGADPFIQNEDGNTVFDLASDENKTIQKLFEKEKSHMLLALARRLKQKVYLGNHSSTQGKTVHHVLTKLTYDPSLKMEQLTGYPFIVPQKQRQTSGGGNSR